MTGAERARLLATIGEWPRDLRDARIAAIVLCALDAGIRPGDALGWRVRDVLRCPPGQRARWEVRPAMRIRGLQTVLPATVRDMLLVYSTHALCLNRITSALSEAPFFGGVTLRAVRVQWHELRRLAGLPGVTFHDLRAASPVRESIPKRAPSLRAVQIDLTDGPGTPGHSGRARIL
jgi:integrase